MGTISYQQLASNLVINWPLFVLSINLTDGPFLHIASLKSHLIKVQTVCFPDLHVWQLHN